MATFFNDIQAALDTHLQSIPGGYTIAWPNVAFEPNGAGTYLRASFLPADTTQAAMGASGLDTTTGIYQVDAVYPAETGRTDLTDDIANHFKRGTILTYNDVNVRVRSVSIAPAIRDGAFYFVPVSISWQTYTEAR